MQKKFLASLITLTVCATAVNAAPAAGNSSKSAYPRQQQLIVEKNSPMRTIHRDKNGQLSGSTQQVGNQTVYRDGKGQYAGTARETGNRIVYRDKNGQISGTAQKVGNRIIYRDSKGQYAGSTKLPAAPKK